MFDSLALWASALAIGSFGVLFSQFRAGIMRYVVFLASVLILHYAFELPYWVLALLTVLAGWVTLGARYRLNTWLVIMPVLALWVAGKIGVVWWYTPSGLLAFVGFSFVLVKTWTLLRDVKAGTITEISFFTVVTYVFLFPTYIAGPMHYYREFESSVLNPRFPNSTEFLDIVLRILVGLTKTKIVTPILMPASLTAVPNAPDVGLLGVVGSSFVYSLVIYSDFSGYCDLAISATRLMGLSTPENFNYPYFSTNIRVFWQRWHITFSRALTNYLFVPLSRSLIIRYPNKRTLVMVLGYLATFAFCGFWHGSTLNFLLWGLYHGVGLICYDLYTKRMTKYRLQRKIGPLSVWRTQINKLAAILGTFIFVSLGWIPFVLTTDVMIKLVERIFHL